MTDRKCNLKLNEIILVITLQAVIFFPRMMKVPVAADEYYWISKSAYLEEWLNLDSQTESWHLNNLTLSGPTLPKYIIALSRLLGGFDRAELDRPENYTFYYEGDSLVGAIPMDKLLFISRAPMVILSILTGLLIYCLLWRGMNRYAAILWLILFIINSSISDILLVAMSESPLLFFSIVSFIYNSKGLSHLNNLFLKNEMGAKKWGLYRYYALAGLSMGMAAASKIHAFLLLATSGVMLLYIVFIPKYPVDLKSKITYLIRLFSICSLTALIIFIALNPSIYENPIKGVGWMFQFRMMALDWQVERNPQFISLSIFQRWLKILQDLMTTNASIRGGLGLFINSALSILGLNLLIRSIITSIKRRLPLELLPSLMIFLSIMILAAFMSPLDWLRYFLFPIIGVMLLISYCTAFLFEKVKAFVKKRAPGKVSVD